MEYLQIEDNYEIQPNGDLLIAQDTGRDTAGKRKPKSKPDLEDEIAEHDTEVCEELALDVRMLGELRADRNDLLLQNQTLR